MKSFVITFICLSFVAIVYTAESPACSDSISVCPEKWRDMEVECINEMRRQIREEMKASIKYLALGAHFSRDTINRPGFAKFFLHSASEEREHGLKLIEYLLMRDNIQGDKLECESCNKVSNNTNDLRGLIMPVPKPLEEGDDIDEMSQAVTNGVSALKYALKLEAKVTKSIREVIKKCEGGDNDYHLVDYLTGVYLEEQYNGQRELAGKISTLGKMMAKNGPLGEFLFDKKLLE